MNMKTTLALIVLVGAGVLLWIFGDPLWSRPNPSARSGSVANAETGEYLDHLRADRITRIEVVRQGMPIVEFFRKPGGVWSLTGNWPLREAEVNALVARLVTLRSRFRPQSIDGDDDLAKMGLDHPAIAIRLTADGEDHTLSFGERQDESSENRFARDTYVRLDKKPEALRLPPGIITALDKPRDYYQQRRLFRGERVAKEGGEGEKVERLDAQSVSVRDKKPDEVHFTMERREGEWRLDAPVRDRVDAAPRDALLAAIPDIWAEQFVPPGTGGLSPSLWHVHPFWDPASIVTDLFLATRGGLLVRSGLTDPERTITVKYANGDTVDLQIGNVSGRRVRLVPAPPQPGMPPGMPQRMMPEAVEYRYAKLVNDDQIFEIKADKLKDVFVALDTLRDSRIARFNAADARRVEVKHGGEDIVLEKDKSEWKLTKPLQGEADTSKVTDLLNKIADLQARDKDIVDKGDPNKYGFAKPDAVVQITVEEEAKGKNQRDAGATAKEKKTRTLTVRIGKHDTDKKKLYVMIDDWPRINIVDDSLAPLVNRSALGYRGKRLFDFNAADVAKIDIDNQGKKVTLEHEKDNWRLSHPVKAEADTQQVDQLLTDLGHLEAAEYVTQQPKKDELETQYGLGKPPLSVRIEFTDKKKPAQVLNVGKERSGKSGYFARMADGGPVFAINAELHKQLQSDSLGYRPQTLWQMIPDEIETVRVQKAGQKEYTLTRSGTDWKLNGPFEATARGDTVQKMANDLAAPRVGSYTAHEAKDLAKYGLDKPALTISFKAVLSKSENEHTLLIGKPVEGGSSARYAKRAKDSAIFTLGDAFVRAVDHSAVDLLDTRLLNLDSAKVDRVRAQSGDNWLTLEKKGKAWQVTDSPAGTYPADAEEAASLSQLWTDLRAQRFADYGKAVDWSKYGLDKPAVRVTLSGPEGESATKEHVIELGKEVKEQPGARYARVDKGAGAAVLPAELARLIQRSYLDYVDHDLLRFDSNAADSLQRRMGDNVLEIVHSQAKPGNEGASWEITKPAKEKADEQTIRQLLDQLGHLRADRIAAYPVKDLQPFGLDAPAVVLTIKLKGEGKSAQHVIKLGKTTGKSGDRFVQVDDGKSVGVLMSSLAEQLAGNPLAFRDRTLARFGEADRLQLDRGPRHAVFSKVEGAWKLTEPLQADAEQNQLDDFARDLGRLRADALVAEKPDANALKQYGLDRPEASWRVQSDNKELLNLLVGNKEPKSGRRYAKLAKGGLVFLLDARLSQKVLDEYRPRTVWNPPLDAVEVEALNYRYNRNPFLLEKAGSNWSAAGRSDAKINAAAVEDTLAALAGLKLSHYAVDKGANLALFGLDKPALILEVATRTGKRVLHIGNVEGSTNGHYARIPDGDRNDVFVLDQESSARILRDLNAFARPPARSPAQPVAR